MKPKPVPTWLVVANQYGEPVSVMELAPLADPVEVMIRAMYRSLEKGWKVEALPGDFSTYFCRKGNRRHMVSIANVPPGDPRLRGINR